MGRRTHRGDFGLNKSLCEINTTLLKYEDYNLADSFAGGKVLTLFNCFDFKRIEDHEEETAFNKSPLVMKSRGYQRAFFDYNNPPYITPPTSPIAPKLYDERTRTRFLSSIPCQDVINDTIVRKVPADRFMGIGKIDSELSPELPFDSTTPFNVTPIKKNKSIRNLKKFSKARPRARVLHNQSPSKYLEEQRLLALLQHEHDSESDVPEAVEKPKRRRKYTPRSRSKPTIQKCRYTPNTDDEKEASPRKTKAIFTPKKLRFAIEKQHEVHPEAELNDPKTQAPKSLVTENVVSKEPVENIHMESADNAKKLPKDTVLRDSKSEKESVKGEAKLNTGKGLSNVKQSKSKQSSKTNKDTKTHVNSSTKVIVNKQLARDNPKQHFKKTKSRQTTSETKKTKKQTTKKEKLIVKFKPRK